MSKINYKKFKISLDPNSVKDQGLVANDIVLRRYQDNTNTFYTLMVVLSTGVDNVVIDGEEKTKKWFIGGLIYGDEPKNDEILDFTRVTSVSNEDRMGAIYLTASDTDAPYIDIVDSIGSEKAINYPSQYIAKNIYSTVDKNSYSAILNDYGTAEYAKEKDGASRVFTLTRNLQTPSTSGNAESFKVLFPTLRGEDFQDKRMMVSFKYRSSLNISVPYRIADTNNNHENMPMQLLPSTSEWKQEIALFDVGALTAANFFSFGAMASWAAGTWLEIAELNIIPLQSLVSWSESSKGRFGKITGVVDSVFGTLRDYGAYFQRLYASKDVNIAGTLTAGDANGFGSTFYVGKIRKNEIVNSLSPQITIGLGSFAIDKVSTNPVGIGEVYSASYVSGNVKGGVIYQAKSWIDKKVATEYTLSFWAKSNSADKQIELAEVYGSGYESMPPLHLESFVLNTDWKRYSVTYAIKNVSEDPVAYVFNLVGASVSDIISICALQLEVGQNATAYQPTDETLSDSEEYGAWMCRGGVGGTIQNPLLTFRSDGSIYGKGGNFHIKANGDAEFRGKVTVVGTGSNIPTMGDIDEIVKEALVGASVDVNDDFARKLGYANYADMTEAAAAKKTVISGGFINTVLLDADTIRATIIKTGYIEGLTLNFTKGTIGGFNINATKLYSGAENYAYGQLAIEKVGAGGRFIASLDGGNFAQMYYYDKDDWGIKGVNRGVEMFSFGNINKIAGWNFTENEFTSPSGKIVLSSLNDSIGVFEQSGGTGARVEMKYINSDDWGLYGLLENGDDVFRLGSVNRIAGWGIDKDKIFTDKIEIGSKGYIKQTENKWNLSSDGSGQLAGGNIVWDKDGNATFTGTVIIAGGGAGGDNEEIVNVIGYDELNVAVDETKDSVSKSLGYDDFDKFVAEAKLGKTVIKGGLINTVLLDVVAIKANIINVNYIEGLSLNFIRGKIANWNIAENQIWNGTNNLGAGNYMIRLSNVNTGTGQVYNAGSVLRGLSLTWYNNDNAGHLVFGNLANGTAGHLQNVVGIQMVDNRGREYFRLSANTGLTDGNLNEQIYNHIAGWRFNQEKIYKNNVEIHSWGHIRHTAGRWGFLNDGSGYLASNNIRWDAAGNVSFASNVSLNWSDGISNAQSTANSAWSTADGVNTKVGNKLTKIDAFGIYTGTLTAQQVNISGNLTAANVNALTCNFNKGKIGGWNIDASSLSNGNMQIHSSGHIRCQQANADKPDWEFNNGGSGSLARGNITWDNAGGLSVKRITATSGSIGDVVSPGGGGWSISSSGFTSSQFGSDSSTGGSSFQSRLIQFQSSTRRANIGISTGNADSDSANIFSKDTGNASWGLKVDHTIGNAIKLRGRISMSCGSNKCCMPGVLAIINKWAANQDVAYNQQWGNGLTVGRCTHQGSSKFKFEHNLNHEEYTVMAIGTSAAYYSIFRLIETKSTYFVIQVVGASGKEDMSSYKLVILGNNTPDLTF